jgi:hypothetical protein
MKGMDKKILVAYRKVYEAEKALHEIVAKAFPVGTEVTWVTTRNALSFNQTGVVIRLGYDDEVIIRNLNTGRTTRHTARYLSYAPLED